jgi:hypothetical protein
MFGIDSATGGSAQATASITRSWRR